MEAKLAEFRRQKHAEFTSNKAKNNPLSPKYIPTAKNRENAFVAFIHRVFRLLATFTIVQKFLAKIEGIPVISNVYFLYFVLWEWLKLFPMHRKSPGDYLQVLRMITDNNLQR